MDLHKPKVDFDYLAHVCQGDTVFMREMIEAFIESIPQYASELKQAYQLDQQQRISELIHKLKPLFMYLKLDDIYQSIKGLQSMTLKERLEGEGFTKLSLTFEQIQSVVSDLKAYLTTHS